MLVVYLYEYVVKDSVTLLAKSVPFMELTFALICLLQQYDPNFGFGDALVYTTRRRSSQLAFGRIEDRLHIPDRFARSDRLIVCVSLPPC